MSDQSVPNDKILESNLKYFEIHAAQRLTVFNFYIAISGTVLAAMAAISQASSRYALAGSILGLLLTVISFVFHKLDVRTSFLVKHAEDVIKKVESGYLPPELSVFALEDSRTQNAQNAARFPNKMYTYGQLFRAIFLLFGMIGIAGCSVMGLRAFGVIDWSEAKDKAADVTVVLRPVAVETGHTEGNRSGGANSSGSPGLSNNVGKVTGETNAPGQNNTRTAR